MLEVIIRPQSKQIRKIPLETQNVKWKRPSLLNHVLRNWAQVFSFNMPLTQTDVLASRIKKTRAPLVSFAAIICLVMQRSHGKECRVTRQIAAA